MAPLSWCLLAVALATPAGSGNDKEAPILIIDNFSSSDGRSGLGTEWRSFTDQVMGGVSRGAAARDTFAGRACLRLRGEVSLENNGGFIQVTLPLDASGRTLDASAYRGIRLTVAGNGRTYSIHLRTSDTRLPWQYYQATFPATDGWQEVDIPFSAFRPENLRAPLDTSRLERLAIAAAKWAGAADVAVARIALYP